MLRDGTSCSYSIVPSAIRSVARITRLHSQLSLFNLQLHHGVVSVVSVMVWEWLCTCWLLEGGYCLGFYVAAPCVISMWICKVCDAHCVALQRVGHIKGFEIGGEQCAIDAC